jgi:catalase
LEDAPPKSLEQNNPKKVVTHAAENIYGLTGNYPAPIKEDIDFYQAGDLWKLLSDKDKDHLVHNIAGHLGGAKESIRAKQIGHFKRAHPDYGRRVEAAIAKAKAN